MRDELILAMDLYLQEGPNPARASTERLSDTLRGIPIESELAADPRFRNRKAVALKISNFASIDPASATGGMPHGGKGDREVWAEFKDRPGHLRRAADAIRSNLASVSERGAGNDDPEMVDAEEGHILTRVHRLRERDSKLRAAKCSQVLKAVGRLECEACGFDFAKNYGPRGENFIEVHHLRPVSELAPGIKTTLDDLALLCSNCHRMVHVRRPWLTLEALQSLVIGNGGGPPTGPALG